MAYNPAAFENVYGFALLDELHNFFPELLYDSLIFPDETFQWMRHRINTLFPRAFARQNHMYQLYSAQTRMRDYVRWILDSNEARRLQRSLHLESTGVEDTPPPLSRISRSTDPSIARPPPPRPPTVAPTAPATLLPPRTPSVLSRGWMDPQVANLFSSVFMDLTGREGVAAELAAQNLLSFFNLAFQDVVVAPTEAEINAASTLRNNDDVPEETVCSICQEHGSEHPWRILACNHYYHRPCIDRWFQSHAQCPVCRTDVRILRSPTSGNPV